METETDVKYVEHDMTIIKITTKKIENVENNYGRYKKTTNDII